MKKKVLLATAVLCVTLIGCSKGGEDAIIYTQEITTTPQVTTPQVTTPEETMSQATIPQETTEEEIVTVRNTFWYAIEDEKALIIKLSAVTERSITIPEVLDGYTLTGIEPRAFMNYTELRDVKWPATIAVMNNQMFFGCTNLMSISIPEGVTSIGIGAFAYCEKLGSIELPDSLISIGAGAFNGCKLLTEITIPDGVTSLGEVTFMDCINLKSITIPASVTSIADDIFACEREQGVGEGLVVHTPKGSYAESWAKMNGYTVVND